MFIEFIDDDGVLVSVNSNFIKVVKQYDNGNVKIYLEGEDLGSETIPMLRGSAGKRFIKACTHFDDCFLVFENETGELITLNKNVISHMEHDPFEVGSIGIKTMNSDPAIKFDYVLKGGKTREFVEGLIKLNRFITDNGQFTSDPTD